MVRRLAGLAASLGLLAVIQGCGSDEPLGVGVSGSVSYKGQPIREGFIQLVPVGNANGTKGGGNIDDGKYVIPRRAGLAPGKYRVEIRAFEETGKEAVKSSLKGQMFGRSLSELTESPGAAEQFAKMKKEKKNIIPDRYNVNSELTRDIPDETQITMDFEL